MRGSVCERQSSNPPRSLRNAFACASPRPARCGACWPLRERARPLHPPAQALQRARACAPLAANAPRAARSKARATRMWCTPGSRAERQPSAQLRIASMPTALPRRPKRAHAMLIPFYDADARPPSPARLQIQNNVGEGSTAASCVLGLKLRTLRVGAALLSSPFSTPSKTLAERSSTS